MGILKSIGPAFFIIFLLLSGVSSADEGKVLYETQCKGCHQLGVNAFGPDLCGLSGRTAGTRPGYSYSTSMKNSGIVWNRESLARFLQSPQTIVPGTKMGIIGFDDKNHREAIASYVLQASLSSTCH